MNKKIIFCLVALCFVCIGANESESKVYDLDDKSFDDHIKAHSMTLVEFFAPWCGHCKQLAPAYEQAASEMDGQDIGTLAKVDCTVHRELCNRFSVRGFPTLKLFKQGVFEPTDYDSGRTADHIVRYMKKQTAPAVHKIKSVDDVTEFAASDPVKIVAFFKSGESTTKYEKVADTLRNDFSFGLVETDTVPAKYGSKVVLLRNFDEPIVKYEGDISAETFTEDLTTFIHAQSFPLVGEIGPENYAKYVDRGFNFVWIFIDKSNADHEKIILDSITPVAKVNRDKLSFVKIDGIRWSEHAKSFGLAGKPFEVVIEDRTNRKNFIFDVKEADITQEKFAKYIDDYNNKLLVANVKSEPIPESNDGPVKVIVGKTFEQIVFDSTKDVFVEFYAPWCGHCKSLAPKYDELGTLFKDDPNVVIAKIDATANDSPAEVQGFPTLLLYRADDKKNPVDFTGDRTVKAMAAFIRKNGKVAKKDGPVPEEEEEKEEHDHEHDHDGHDHGHADHDDL